MSRVMATFLSSNEAANSAIFLSTSTILASPFANSSPSSSRNPKILFCVSRKACNPGLDVRVVFGLA